jgi:4-hydroxybenzoate polyprenyltransferase
LMLGFFSFFLRLNDIIFLLPLGILSVLYSFPLVKYHGEYVFLKHIPGIKTLLIAFVWSTVTVLMPFYRKYGLGELNFSSSMILIERFLLISFVCFQFDIRDIHIDKKLRIKSLPGILGVRTADYISIGFLVLGIGLGYYQSLYDTFHVSILCLPFVFGLLIRLLKPWLHPEFYYSFWVDGVMIFPVIFLIV